MIDIGIFHTQEIDSATSFYSTLLYPLYIPLRSIIVC